MIGAFLLQDVLMHPTTQPTAHWKRITDH